MFKKFTTSALLTRLCLLEANPYQQIPITLGTTYSRTQKYRLSIFHSYIEEALIFCSDSNEKNLSVRISDCIAVRQQARRATKCIPLSYQISQNNFFSAG